jgi:molecular chaperone GrpE
MSDPGNNTHTKALEPVIGDSDPAARLEREAAGLRRELDVRTADLRRMTAEYTDYRNRIERNRGLVAALAKASVVRELLPVLDDLERAEAHGDLTNPAKAIVDRLFSTLGTHGLLAFGRRNERFDPAVHEAVHHQRSSSPGMAEPTVTAVLRRGYRFGGHLLRAALVEVTEPEPVDGATGPPE